MQVKDDILSLLREKVDQVAREMQRAVILQPGAIGDNILTLPLAQFMKNSLGLGRVDIFGHTEYIGILPGRSCVDGIRSIDSTELHRLFVEPNKFVLADGDPLINVFTDYTWIVTFLGEPNGNFEQNLIFTANCSHSAEIITLSMKPPKDFHQHLIEYFTQQLIEQCGLSLERPMLQLEDIFLKPTKEDVNIGRELLKEVGLEFPKKVVIIHPGSGGIKKCWHLGNFLSIAKELGSREIEVVFLLGPAELDRFSKATIKEMNSVARCLADLSLSKVIGLLSCCYGYVGNDSGITHLAACMGLRTAVVFGPTNPSVYRPIGPSVKVFTNSMPSFSKQICATLQEELLEALLA